MLPSGLDKLVWVHYVKVEVIVDQATVEKVVIMSHYVLQHVFGIPNL